MDKPTDQKLGMVIKGGLQGQPGNPHDQSDEGVFISKINEGGCIDRGHSDKLKVYLTLLFIMQRSLPFSLIQRNFPPLMF